MTRRLTESTIDDSTWERQIGQPEVLAKPIEKVSMLLVRNFLLWHTIPIDEDASFRFGKEGHRGAHNRRQDDPVQAVARLRYHVNPEKSIGCE